MTSPMNKNSHAYACWAVLAFIAYSIGGLFTEHEFLPNPIWLITGKPAPGFCPGCQTGLVLIVIVIILIPVAIWLRKKSSGDRALISKKNLAAIIGILLVIGGVIGFFLLQREWQEEREAQVRYENIIRNNQQIVVEVPMSRLQV